MKKATQRNAPLLSLCMIVRDSSRTLRPALETIKPWVDELVVVDTGSQDNTKEIAVELGARVFDFPWIDDFSAARNESIRHARGQWLFWMDSDDTIDVDNGRKLSELARGRHESRTLGYVVKVRCPGGLNNGVADFTEVDHVKLFRNHLELRFEFRIHEQLLPAIRRMGGEVGWSDIYVVHSGSDSSPEARRAKCDRDLRILDKELADRPDHPFALFNVGMTYSDMERHAEAAEVLERAIEVADPTQTQVRKAYALLVNSYDRLGQNDLAWTTCQRGLEHFQADPELRFRLGQLAHDRRDYDSAIDIYQSLLEEQDGDHFSSIDPGIIGYKARHNLALVYQDAHRFDLAELKWRQVLDDEPDYRVAYRSLGKVLIKQRKLATAEVLAQRMAGNKGLEAEMLTLHASIAEARGDLLAAQSHLESAVTVDQEDTWALHELCRLLLDQGNAAHAIEALCELARHEPNNGATHHNLGTAYEQAGQTDKALECYERSLEVRPDYPMTWFHYGRLLQAVGQENESQAALRRADELNATANDDGRKP